MKRYCIELNRSGLPPGIADFSRFYKTYSGVGIPAPEKDNPQGEGHRAFVESEKILTLDGLREDFPNLNISSVEEVLGLSNQT